MLFGHGHDLTPVQTLLMSEAKKDVKIKFSKFLNNSAEGMPLKGFHHSLLGFHKLVFMCIFRFAHIKH